MSAFEFILERARSKLRRVVLPEAADDRILCAAASAARQGLAWPVLLGSADSLHERAIALQESLEACEIVDPSEPELIERCASALVLKRQHRGMTREKAIEALADPVTLACAMVATGDVDGCVAGACCSTAEVVNNALRYVGKSDTDTQVSSFFLMLMGPGHPVQGLLLLADCALVIAPDDMQLADIAIATGESAQRLIGMTPEIAMLSFSTAGSARHASVRKVQRATERLRSLRPDWRVVGEVQLDAAVVPAVLQRKAPAQATDSPCNTLIFPDLNAGNIGYKLLERFAGAVAVGPILQGLTRPVNDLSRGCSTEDVVNIIAVTAAQVD